MSDPRLTISHLTDTSGYWTATVTLLGGEVLAMDRKYGSWQREAPLLLDGQTVRTRRDVPFYIAEALQAQVLPIERARRKAAA